MWCYSIICQYVGGYSEGSRDLLVENSTEPTKKLEIKQMPEGT
ncbi:unnamed protein product [Rhodiola kirilowii]